MLDAMQRQFATQPDPVLTFSSSLRRDARGLKKDLRVASGFEDLFTRLPFDLAPIRIADVIYHCERIGEDPQAHGSRLRGVHGKLDISLQPARSERRAMSECRKKPFGECVN